MSTLVPRTLLAAATASLLAAAPASAATVDVGGKCFASWPSQSVSQPIPVQVAGLPAGASVRVSVVVGSSVVGGTGQLIADSTGSLITSIQQWSYGGSSAKAAKGKKASIVVTDFANGGAYASTGTKVVKVGISVDTKAKKARSKRTWKVSGLSLLSANPGKSYYAHYFKSGSSKKVAKQKLGKVKDACGYLSVKKPLAPFFKTGTYDVKVQASKSFNKNDSWLGGSITLYKKFL